jgi:thymidine phosphorylase
MVAALGGPATLVECPDRHLAAAPVRLAVSPARAGVVVRVDARAIGHLAMQLGAGRRRTEDVIDPAVGLADVRAVGEAVGADRPLAIVHARSAADAAEAAATRRAATSVGDEPPASIAPPVLRRLGAS